MPEKRAIIRISAVKGSALDRALNGAAQSADRASRRVASSTRRALTEQERAARDQEREAKRLARTQEREIERVRRAKEREAREAVRRAERVAREEAREAQKSARAQIREAQKAAKERAKAAQKAIDARRAMIAGGVGAAFGFATGAAGLLSRGQQAAGVGSLEQRLGVTAEFRERLISAANEAGVSTEERQRIEERVLSASEATNMSILDMAAALESAQKDFDRFADFGEIIGDLAAVAKGTSTPLGELVQAVGNAQRQFGLMTAQQQRDFVDVLVSTAQRGSIEAGAVARDIGPLMGQFVMRTGRGGVGGARELLAFTQVLGQAQPGQSAEIATQMGRFLLELSDVKTQRKLRRLGVEVRDPETGLIRDIGDIGQQMLQSPRFQTASARQGAFGRVEALKAAEFLMQALERDPEAFRQLQNIETGAGAASAQRGLQELRSDPMFDLLNVGARAQAATVRDADRIVKKITPAIEKMTELQSEFPLMTESMSVLNDTIKALIVALAANSLITGSGGILAKGGAAATAARSAGGGLLARLGLGGAGAAAAGAGGIGLGGAAAAVGTGLATYGLTTAALDAADIDLEKEAASGGLVRDLLGLATMTRLPSWLGGVDEDSQVVAGGEVIARSKLRGTGLDPAAAALARARQEQERQDKPLMLDDRTIEKMKGTQRLDVGVTITREGDVEATVRGDDIEKRARSGSALLR